MGGRAASHQISLGDDNQGHGPGSVRITRVPRNLVCGQVTRVISRYLTGTDRQTACVTEFMFSDTEKLIAKAMYGVELYVCAGAHPVHVVTLIKGVHDGWSM